MDAVKLLSKLKELGIKDLEEIESSDIDWIFHDNNLKPLQRFFEFIYNNYSPKDVLSEEEIEQFEKLKEENKVYSSSYLANLNKVDFECSQILEHGVRSSFQDQSHIYQMELYDDIAKHKENISQLEMDIANLEMNVDLVNSECRKENKRLSSSLDSLINDFRNFKNSNGEKFHLVQLSFDNWFREQDKYSICLQEYIDKQFNYLGSMITNEEEEPCFLLDSGNIDGKLLKGDDQLMYNFKAKELRRLSKVIESSEMGKIKAEVDKSMQLAKLSELESILGSSSVLSNANALKQKQEELCKIGVSLDKDIKEKWELINQNVKSVANVERSKTISGNYHAKKQRQKYIMEKQKGIMDAFLNQIAHFDFMRICIETELKDLLEITELIKEIHDYLVTKHERSKQRQEHISKNISTRNLSLDEVPEYINTEVVSKLSDGSLGCEQILDELESINEKKNSVLEKMKSLCTVYEKCLFGKANSPSDLPYSWLKADLLSEYHTLDKGMRDFQQNVYSFLKDVERNKQALSLNPDLEKQMFQWADELK